MLSKKMAFSLMRLITIFALALVALPVSAADPFAVTFEGRESVTYTPVTTGTPADVTVVVTIKTGQSVADPAPTVTAFDKNNIVVAGGASIAEQATTGANSDPDYVATGTQRKYVVTINPDAVTTTTVTKVIVSVAQLTTNDPTAVDDKGALVMTKLTSYTRVITVSKGAVPNTDRPKVVSIQRLRPSSQAVVAAFQEEKVTGAFDVRIVLTELPHDFKLATINVESGTASNLVKGVPFARFGVDGDADNTIRPHPSEGMYEHAGDGPLAGVPPGVTGSGNVPMPTGTDNMYHQYRVTITPHRRADMVKISVKEFHDNASPFPNVYKPFGVANKPNGREQLRLAVATPTMSLGTGVMLSLPHDDDVKITEKQKADATAADAAETVAAEKVKAEAATVAVERAADTSVMIPEVGQIYISEVMFAGGGSLPQWIEISNSSRTEQVNLGGWTLTVENAKADADVSVGAKAVFTIPEGTRIDPSGQHDTPSTVLVVTEVGRNNLDGAMADGQVVNLWSEQQVELILLDIFKRRYSLLSDMAFKITLAPPEPDVDAMKRKAATDVVGNLGADGAATWALPMAEGKARSSIIRRHVSVGPGTAEDGEMMDSWVLASDTGFAQSTHLTVQSYYGLPIDVGTPGFRAGGALPVELSHFRPERRKDTGAVVITWSTQSELNNAGFFIKRRQQRDGEFQIINAAMIQGAGTTSEKQFYTYTDTTAQPNVVYYYQIEDVSLDGDRRTLTRGIRVGAASKATTLWGELKRTN